MTKTRLAVKAVLETFYLEKAIPIEIADLRYRWKGYDITADFVTDAMEETEPIDIYTYPLKKYIGVKGARVYIMFRTKTA